MEVPVGYPANQRPPADRYGESRIHYDRWQESSDGLDLLKMSILYDRYVVGEKLYYI